MTTVHVAVGINVFRVIIIFGPHHSLNPSMTPSECFFAGNNEPQVKPTLDSD